MASRVLVVPHGTGIGDLVNVRPLVEAVERAHPGSDISVLAPAHLAWLLPSTVSVEHELRGPTTWSRMEPDHALARAMAGLSARSMGRIMSPRAMCAAARGLTRFLELRGFDRVVSLLELFTQLDLDARWTAGPWSVDRRHLIDLLAAELEQRNIPIPQHVRRPCLPISPWPLGQTPAVVIAPNAGSTLKEPPLHLWVHVAARLVDNGIVPQILAAPRRATAEQIVQRVPRARIISDNDLRRVTAMLAGADIVVAPDTGILHLAAAVGTPWVGLFGATDPRFLGPYHGHGGIVLHSATRHRSVCRRCWTTQMLPAARCGVMLPENCLADIDPQAVMASMHQLLQDTKRARALP